MPKNTLRQKAARVTFSATVTIDFGNNNISISYALEFLNVTGKTKQ
jgi:hypothetical protein